MVEIAFVGFFTDVEVAPDEMVTTEAAAPVEEQAEESADSGESESDVEVETTSTTEDTVDSTTGESEPPADGEDEATSTTVPPSTTTITTSEPPAEEIIDELELIEILGTKVGAGSGEYEVVVSGRPEGFERFKLSLSSADG